MGRQMTRIRRFSAVGVLSFAALASASCVTRTAYVSATVDMTVGVRKDTKVAVSHGSGEATLFLRNAVALSKRLLAARGTPVSDLENATYVLIVSSDEVNVPYEIDVPVKAGSVSQTETGNGSFRVLESTTYRNERQVQTWSGRRIWFALFEASYLKSIAKIAKPMDPERAIWRCYVGASARNADADLEKVLWAGIRKFGRHFAGDVDLDDD